MWQYRVGIMLLKSFTMFTIAIFSGGAVFMLLERHEAQKSLSPQREITLAKRYIFQLSNMSRKEIDDIFLNVEKAIRQNGVKEPYKWNYYESCFFVGSLLTTIGYGHIAPKTVCGQLFAVFYSFFGIPLTVLVVRKLSNRIIDTVVQIVKFICKTRNRIGTARGDPGEEYIPGQSNPTSFPKRRMNRRAATKQRSNRFLCSGRKTKILCIVVLFIMVLFFLTFSSMIRVISEGWTMQQSIYFWVITLTTIGFGDFVPYDGREPPSVAATVIYYSGTFYLMFGLALIASLVQCISVIFEGRLPAVAKENVTKASICETEMITRCIFMGTDVGYPIPDQPNRLKEIDASEFEVKLLSGESARKAVLYSSLRIIKLCIPEGCIGNTSASRETEGSAS